MGTSSISSASSANSLKIGGLASGLNTDEIVDAMLLSSKNKINAQQQKVTKLEWKQEAYQGFTKQLLEFQTKYLDRSSSTNATNDKFFTSFSATASSSAVKVSGNLQGAANIKINSISQIASNASLSGSMLNSNLTLDMTGTTPITDEFLNEKTISFSLNGVTKTIDLSGGATYMAENDADFADFIQSKLDSEFGAGKVSVDLNSDTNKLTFNTTAAHDSFSITGFSNNIKYVAADDEAGVKESEGLFTDIATGLSNKFNQVATIEQSGLFGALTADAEGNYTLNINDKEITFNKDDSIKTVLSKINTTDADVKISFNDFNNAFKLETKETGASSKIKFGNADTVSFFNALGFDTSGIDAEGVVARGNDTVMNVTVDGVTTTIERSTTNVTINGVTIEAREVTDTPVTFEVENNVDNVIDNIKGFLKDYNDILDKLYKAITETPEKGFDPLTEEQKEEMTEEEIEKWEEKAKQGILRSDTALRTVYNQMREAMTGFVSDSGLTLMDLGIGTTGYKDHGKLSITDEDKLRKQLLENSDQVAQMFTQTAPKLADGSADMDNLGMAQRVNEVIKSAANTVGTKGSLVQLAGYPDTASAKNNVILNKITNLKDLIDTLNERMADEEERYWSKFTNLETQISKFNSQSSWLSSM